MCCTKQCILGVIPMVSSCMYFNFVNVTRIDLIPTIERDFVCIVMDDGFFFTLLVSIGRYTWSYNISQLYPLSYYVLYEYTTPKSIRKYTSMYNKSLGSTKSVKGSIYIQACYIFWREKVGFQDQNQFFFIYRCIFSLHRKIQDKQFDVNGQCI